jgi:hypothetical protein
MPPYSQKRPNESSDNKYNINRSKNIVFQTKLYWSKYEVENQIKQKRQGNKPGNFALQGFVKNKSEGDKNENIKDCPNRTKKPRGWSPEWLYKFCVIAYFIHKNFV